MNLKDTSALEKLIHLYQQKLAQLAQLNGNPYALQYLVVSAEADALDRAIRRQRAI